MWLQSHGSGYSVFCPIVCGLSHIYTCIHVNELRMRMQPGCEFRPHLLCSTWNFSNREQCIFFFYTKLPHSLIPISQVREVFGIEGDSPTHASATIACFLVQEGADMYTYNKKGHTPLQICAPDVASLVTTFTRREG